MLSGLLWVLWVVLLVAVQQEQWLVLFLVCLPGVNKLQCSPHKTQGLGWVVYTLPGWQVVDKVWACSETQWLTLNWLPRR